MSRVNYLEKLLDGARVEWKEVSEIFHLKNGYTPSKSNKEFWENGTIPWFRMDDIRQNGQILDDSLQKITESAIKGEKLFPENSIIISTSATIGEHALITVPHLANQRFTVLSLKKEYTNKFNIKFLFYYSFLLADWCKQNTTMSSFASVDMDGFKKFQIPIPCPENPAKSLAIQAEIVRILDAFTALTAELTAELTARKKQYNHYRDQLLTFEEGERHSYLKKLLDGARVEWVPLGEVAQIYGGLTGKTKADFENGDAKYISYRNIFKNSEVDADSLEYVKISGHENQNTVRYGDILFTGSSEIADEVGMSSAVTTKIVSPIYLNSFSFGVRFNELVKLTPEFSKHLFRSRFMRTEIAKTASGVTRFNISKALFKKILIPIPCSENPAKSLAIQAEIVRILDKFNTLTNSLQEGLPREIALRQQQYAYYRDLLLNFPKPQGVA